MPHPTEATVRERVMMRRCEEASSRRLPVNVATTRLKELIESRGEASGAWRGHVEGGEMR